MSQHAVLRAVLLFRFTLCTCGVDGTALDTPILLWVNTPVLPNETAIIQGAGFGNSPHVTITPIEATGVS